MNIEEKAKAYDEALALAKRLISNNCTEVEKLCLKCVFPELKESEDERIIEEIKFAVMQMPSERQDTKNRCLAWLEKQKEQKLNPDKKELIRQCVGSILTDATDERFKDYGLTLKDCLTWLDEQEEQKSGELDKIERLMKALQVTNAQIGQLVEENYKLKEQKPKMTPKWLYRLEFKDNTCGLWYDGNGKWCFESGIGSIDGCKTKTLPMDYDERYKQDGRNWFSSCSKKEDLLHWYSLEDAKKLISNGFVFTRYLATEYHEYDQQTVFIKETSLYREEIDIFELFKQKPAEKQDYSGLNDLERAIHRGFLVAGVENVSVTLIKETAYDCLAQMKPAEWSEEDADMLNCCISSIEEAKENRYAYKETDGDTSYDREIDWLKSLRPQLKQKWSEEDEENINTLIEVVHERMGLSEKRKQYYEKWLKSLRHKPHTVSTKDATKFGNLEYERGVKDGIQSEKSRQWKPTEEQIYSLSTVVKGIGNVSVGSVGYNLKELYEQLKKLM